MIEIKMEKDDIDDIDQLIIEDDPVQKGIWEPVKYQFRHLPVHVALLHTGKVLAFGGSGNDETRLTSPYSAEIFEPDMLLQETFEKARSSNFEEHSHDGNKRFDTPNGRVYEIPTEVDGDIFCSGHAFLPDGRLMIAGGTYKYDGKFLGLPVPPFSGLDHSYIFDPLKLRWNKCAGMKNGRWYPTCISLPDGRVLAMAGLSKNFPWAFLNKLEVYTSDDAVGEWHNVVGGNHWVPMYPRLHLLPSGDIFYAGSYNTHYTFPFSLRSFPSAIYNIRTNKWTRIGNPNNIKREEGTSVLLPLLPPDYVARVLLIGGGTQPGTDAINDVEMIDFSDRHPRYKSIKPMKHPRYYAYAVLLPDQTVLVLGGKTGTKGHMMINSKMNLGKDSSINSLTLGAIPHDPHAVLEPELYDLTTKEWHPMASMKVDRLYHANAILLPDGRVMASGSNPDRRMNELRIEIYRPPYLFKGKRPTISKIPKTILYGNEFEIETTDTGDIKSVALMRPSVTTHCVNTEQRYVGLEFTRKNSNLLSSNVTFNRNVIPPGYYMLFLLSQNDVPSIGHFTCIA
jgi:hypothetical protein